MTTPSLRLSRLRIEHLEDRAVPAAATHDITTIAVGFATGNPQDPVRTQAVRVNPGQTVDAAIAAWRATAGVLYAEPNYTYSSTAIPNDPNFSTQYAQNNTGQSGGTVDADIDSPEAWDITRGNTRTTVAVIDTGVDYTHPDLYLNIWINQAEIPASVRANLTDVNVDGAITFHDLNNSVNIGSGKIIDLNGNGRIDGGDLLQSTSLGGWADGVDNGTNSFIDDLIGWDFVGNDNNPMDVVAENGGHGTHVAGTIGASGNNGIGVAGVAWDLQIMPVRFLGTNGGTSTAAASSIRYSAANGAVISNNSWGGGGYSQTLFDAINFARTQGQVFVAAAGNSTSNNDTTASYPSNYALDNVVAVAATDRNDRLASFSSYGRTTVDLAAPGVSIISTYPNSQYATMSGTSMATPQVSGVLALVRGQDTSLTYAQSISRVLGAVDPIAALSTVTVTGGRLNASRALVSAPPVDVTGPAIVSMSPNATGTSPVSSVRLTFSEAILDSSFTTADVAITGPNGVSVPATAISAVGTAGTQFDISFASQSTAATYTVRVGPNITDLTGNAMDQDRDGINAEATQDQFVGTFTITSPPSTSTTTFSNTTALTIADRTTVVSRITINQDLTISDLNVLVNLTHTYVGDVSIVFAGPDGTTVTLFNRRGGSGDNLTNTVFNDEAATAISAGRAPFTGSFKPEQLLSSFDGKLARGTWELRIKDNARGDVGRLLNWSLIVTTGNPGTMSTFGGIDFGIVPQSNSSSPTTFVAFPVTPNSTNGRSGNATISVSPTRGNPTVANWLQACGNADVRQQFAQLLPSLSDSSVADFLGLFDGLNFGTNGRGL